MRVSSDELLTFLKNSNINALTVEHPPVFTVAESQRLRGEIPGEHTKNLFLRDNNRNYFLVVAGEDRSVDLKRLCKLIGARGRLSFAPREALAEVLGIEAGAVSPLAVINDEAKRVQVIIERELLTCHLINCHPLVNYRTTSLSPQQLLDFLKNTGHEPLRVDL
ncbi:MAG TPA: prolyl-tRNA synthetase associated domain-containing protein [bacterium]|nr:prolyl-tRNA synthetase associated domain-containing protein [bacterium]